jgi:hypothetical protein
MPTKFDFLSPGIELREIDQSAIAAVPENDGLLLIGRAKKGPAMKPIKITSLADFQAIFGTPMDGVKRGDPWREGNTGGGGWAAYAAEAYLAAGIGPVKFIRLAGEQDTELANPSDAQKAGWTMATSFDPDEANNDGAMGIFVAETGTATLTDPASAVFDFNFAMGTSQHAAKVIGTTNTVSMTIEHLVLDDPSASITVTFYDSDYSSAPAGIAVDIGANSVLGAAATDGEEIADCFFAQQTAIQNAADVTVAQNGSQITITMTQLGAAGNLKSITADEAIMVVNATNVTEVEFSGGTQSGSGNGVLAAILYADGVGITLSGDDYSGVQQTEESAHLIKSAAGGNWTAVLSDGLTKETVIFNFNPSSQNFIRNVFSSDATLIGDNDVTSLAKKVFLGESFEYNVQRLGGYNSAGDQVAFVAGLYDANKDFGNHQVSLAGAKTGWFIGSAASQEKRLFRFAALDEGSDFHKNHIVRIKDLRAATVTRPEASFSVEIARAGQSPAQYVEKFTNVTLNPDSPNYIVKKIGDLAQEWDASQGKIVSTGSFTNQSNLVRVEMAPNNVNKTDLPLGFLGPAKINPITLNCDAAQGGNIEWISGKNTIPTTTPNKNYTITGAEGFGYTMTISWPTHALSEAGTYLGNGDYAPSAIMGLAYDSQRGLENFGDIGILKADFNPHLEASAAASSAMYKFSLENMILDPATGLYYRDTAQTSDFETILNDGVRQFAAPFFGGSDGVNIKHENPFNEYQLANDTYAKYSLESAISQVADYYTSRYDLIAIPGVTNKPIMKAMVDQTAERGDALAIVDLPGIYQDAVDTGNGEEAGSVSTIIRTVEEGYASSYAAAYYPNVRIADVSSGNGSVLMAPPSVAAIGAIAKSEALSQPWFAPAGFNRGGLAPLGGNGGANVVGTLEHLSKADRDNLYNVNINPIARFPATGDTVIFGQKTLQPEQTALDRINVRRMMIYLKKRIGGIADTFLFEQGVKATYDRFKATIEPILSEVRSQYGITEYKVILDETTTTPDLQDRNIMYAKVYVKPAKAIEYVVIDFVVTQSGVEF